MRLRLLGVLSVMVLIVAACGGGDPHADVTKARDAESVAAGAVLYEANCASCHGSDLRGGDEEGIIDKELSHPDDKLVEVIAEGKGDEMPGFAGDLSADEIQSIVDYVRTIQAGDLEG